jgi:hypothetical protein
LPVLVVRIQLMVPPGLASHAGVAWAWVLVVGARSARMSASSVKGKGRNMVGGSGAAHVGNDRAEVLLQ